LDFFVRLFDIPDLNVAVEWSYDASTGGLSWQRFELVASSPRQRFHGFDGSRDDGDWRQWADEGVSSQVVILPSSVSSRGTSRHVGNLGEVAVGDAAIVVLVRLDDGAAYLAVHDLPQTIVVGLEGVHAAADPRQKHRRPQTVQLRRIHEPQINLPIFNLNLQFSFFNAFHRSKSIENLKLKKIENLKLTP